MIIVFLFIVLFISFIVFFSRLKISIQSLEIKNKRIKSLQVIISLALFGKLDVLKLKLNNNSVNNILKRRLNIKVLTEPNRGIVKDWKILLQNIKIENMNLNIEIGTENAAVTAYIVGIVSAIIGFVLPHRINDIRYVIEPLYNGENQIFLALNGIFTVKLVHIISIRKELKNKGVV